MGEFQSQLTNLEHNAVYYVRAYATNSLGTAYGEQVKFTTTEGVAVVVTDSVYNIAAHTAKCKAHVVNDGGFAVTKRGVCWSNKPDPTIDDNITEEGSGLGEYTATLKDLVENTTYYVRAYATNITATAYGEQIIITTLDGLAVVQTDSVSAVTTTTLTAYGTVVFDCDIPVTTRGFCYATTQYPTTEDAVVPVGKGLGSYQGNIKNLQIGTTYYLRAFATNETGTAYGTQISFTTENGRPVLTTAQTTATSTEITSGGNITSDGGYSITARGVCYSTTTSNPTIEDSHTTAGIGTGEFSTVITDVTFSTTYYVRAYATNSIATSYGEVMKVVTGDGRPMVTTTPITKNGSSFISGGYISDDGGGEVTARGICYGKFPHPDLSDTYSHTSDGAGTGYYTSTITGISGTIYLRAYATNANGTAYGEEVFIDLNYLSLSSFVFNGRTYRVAPTASTKMSWDDAYTYCYGLTLYGYSDWRLPNTDELHQMYTRKTSIGGFTAGCYWSIIGVSYTKRYDCVDFSSGKDYVWNSSSYGYVRPIRVEKE